jgi:hypothetical protein
MTLRATDVALSLSQEATDLLRELKGGSQLVYSLRGPVFELMQHGLCKQEIERGPTPADKRVVYRVRITAEGRSVAGGLP